MVSFLYHQAYYYAGSVPIRYTFSCDDLAAQGKRTSRWIPEGDGRVRHVAPGSILLLRRGEADWVHTGIVTEITPHTVTAIEGNTNDVGAREGYEACERTRNLKGKDFIAV